MSASTTYSDSPTPQPQTSQYSYQSYSDVSQQLPQTSQPTTAVAASSSSTATVPSQPQTRQAAEEARKDRTLAEFLLMLDEYEPLIPNEVTDYYLQRVGFECEDVRLNSSPILPLMHINMPVYAQMRRAGGLVRPPRVLELQKFVFTNPAPIDEFLTSPKDKTRTTLTMDDLSAALAEYGINARKPEFYI
ncbi:hypothetical protein J3R82DRAFT_2426 [Butyriboletus roseoflavus]|nr:hypothetical protein J3R82DRAFT_2426 [Butyriboletus roseoflavus]